jgi:ABC-2 type transport system permease protein
MTTSAETGRSGEAHGRHSAGSEQGVIHDIGYRHYKGRRLGRGYVTRSLFVDSLRGAYGLGRSARSKVMPMLLGALMCLPALVIVIVVNATAADRLPLAYTDYALRLQTVVAIFVAAQAPQSVSRDLRFHTMPLYLSRPPRRVDYVLAKYAAMTSAGDPAGDPAADPVRRRAARPPPHLGPRPAACSRGWPAPSCSPSSSPGSAC